MTKLKATRKLSDINFEDEGSHVALVGDFQGGAANGFSTLITKATNEVSDEDLQNALEQNDINKSQTEEVDTNMSTMTEDQVKEAITKALADNAKETETLIAKAKQEAADEAEAKFSAQAAELQVLKALEDGRKEAKYADIAKSHKTYLGESVEEADLIKALKDSESVESLAVLVKALEDYKNIVKNADKLVELGKSNTKPQPTSSEAKLDAAITKYRSEHNVTEAVAMKALSESQPELFSELYSA
jgi:hypothetical protein